MKLHNVYSYGQLFCFSGLDGQTSRKDDFVGMFMAEPITIRFHFDSTVTLKFPFEKSLEFKAVTGDFLDGDDFFIAFKDRKTIVGKSRVKPVVLTEKQAKIEVLGNKERVSADFCKDFFLVTEQKDEWYYFAFSYADENLQIAGDSDLDQLKKSRYSYFEKLPPCKDEKYERLYYKCLSVHKENVHSPEGAISYRWTTPDRVPHRFLWLWDSVFHGMAFAEYNLEMAKDAIKAVLAMQDKDGFIAHMMSEEGFISEITQPQVIAWGVWNVYQKDKDKQFLSYCAPIIDKFLVWTMKNRDKNGNGLLEWFTEPDYTNCRCGESGLDNCPRFDFDVDMDAIDFSTYLCNDAKYLSFIYDELGEKERSSFYMGVHESVKDKINDLLWCEEDGLYYDRLLGGELTKVASFTSFLPMFAGICSQSQADKMVKVLLDENRFWTQTAIPSMPKDSEFYDIDMWRGCTWLNLNYFIMLGLLKYGYTDIANELKQKTLGAVYKWYEKTGNVFEFYDADNKICPLNLKRKGEQPQIPDYRVHVHSITDYNWSTCFTMLLIQGVNLI